MRGVTFTTESLYSRNLAATLVFLYQDFGADPPLEIKLH